ncbi:efflux RND transporter permease subunit [Hyphococcus flavus]|uniref:Efflux RND transporter permease subunit n=1 Tax=Hyphococcus flavus TaxID=1866326 RepID=A0AAE9ZGG6_9PROT|nr:efflux RND transporter permease subunit [Hyphococcus flavus]WDI32523.1 efflux RND transporter permease subunit [Hyphococcus flavus]
MTDHSTPAPGSSGGFIGTFIQRPILAAVLSLLIVIAGLAALFGVEVRELPDVDQPVVSIDTNYPGATPETVDAEVTAIIEGAIAQVDGIQNISSSSGFGDSDVNIEFSSSVDIDIAATDVQNAISSVFDELPEEVELPRVRKADSNGSAMMRLSISSPDMDPGDLARLVDDVVVPRLQAVEGVAQADSYGARNKLIRIRVRPVSLAARGYTVEDVARLAATAAQSTPSGRLRSDTQQILIRAEAPATTPEAIAALRLDDQTRLSDVAIVEWGYQGETTTARVNGDPGIGIGIVRQAQSNTMAVSAGVRRAVDELNQSLPQSVTVTVRTDDSIFISEAVREVFKSLLLATAIVVFVIFLFLRSLRATMIPAVTIPISLLGTVAAIYLAGFSINLITLLALVMAAGLVVDDAVVVTENIQRWRAKGAGKRAAAVVGTREIIFAVLATTATLAAVFIPISFLPGQAGRLFSEFGFVMAFAVMVSSFVALTLCPVLTVRLGREHRAEMDNVDEEGEKKPDGPLAKIYGPMLRFVLGRPVLVTIASLVFAAGAVVAFKAVPNELTPEEDRGRVFVMVLPQDGASFEYLDLKVLEIEQRLQQLVDDGFGESIVSINGVWGGNRSFVVFSLPDWSERDFSQSEVERRVRQLVGDIPGVSAIIRSGNSLGIRGAGQGLRFAVVGDDYTVAAAGADAIAERMMQSPLFADVRTDFQTSQPQVRIDIDREAATSLGVPISAITRTVQVMADEFRAAQVFVGDDIINIMMSGAGEPVNDPTDLANIFLRANNGDFVPLSSLASVEEVAVASQLAREQRRRAVPVSAELRTGVPLGDAVTAMQAIAAETLEGNLSVTLLGEAKVLQDSNRSTLLVFAFAGLIVFLVLAAQFESFVSSLIIMVTVPFGLAAAMYAIMLTGGSINYYSQIGLVLLIGIMAKNGILIVEFANQQRDRGYSVREAIERAAMVRLRPVLMTAISTLLASLPLILGSGAGAESRAALGWVIFGGLGFAAIFTLFLTPVSFLMLAGLAKPRAAEGQKVAEELAKAPAA